MTTAASPHRSRASLASMVTVVLLVVANTALAPERIVVWGAAGILVTVMWLSMSRAESRHAANLASLAELKLTQEAILGAGIVLSASLLLTILRALHIELPDVTARAIGVLSGAALVGVGNAMPKTLPRWTNDAMHAARAQVRQRFAGWTFTTAGLATIGCWLLLPEPLANQIALVLCGTAVLLVTTRTCTPRIPRRHAS